MNPSPHLWLALSPHGYGHAAMTAPLVAELRRRRPGLRLTIQTALPREFLATRYDAFELVDEIPDFGFRMKSATEIDVEASAAGYASLHADFDALISREALRLRAARPDLVLANVPYVTIAAAAEAGVPVAAFSSLNWADMYGHYLGDRPEAPAILRQMRDAYSRAAVFLRCTPAQAMTLPNVRDIGVVARLGRRRMDLAQALGAPVGTKVGLIAFGGIDHSLPLECWPRLEGWIWVSTLVETPERIDFRPFEAAGMPFADVLATADLLIAKPGYGTFTEAGLAGVPVLYVPRPGWPECPHLENWLARHTQCLSAPVEELTGEGLALLLQKLFSLPKSQVAKPSGVVEGCDFLERALYDKGIACERS